MGDTREGSCKRPEFRNCNDTLEKTKGVVSAVRRQALRFFGLRNEDLCGTRAWQDPYRNNNLEREKRAKIMNMILV